uniref:Uncharacterized protein n=1 Tax=Daphnia galeata TaxID=27404 RepID=A0A8J2WQ12_9CRUS|nr:unnamed protein product [Daphnia galeata]
MTSANQNSVDKPPEFPKMVGKFLVLNKFARVKNNEKNGHVFYHGTFEGKVKVFVRRIQKVVSSDSAEKVVGHYIVTELCLLSVEDLFYPKMNENEKKKEDNILVLIENRTKILESLTIKDILRQATEGLVYLHSFNFVHRNLKPSNVLIAQDKRNQDKPKYVVKLSDFRTAKNLQDKKEQEHSGYQGSDGWIAPYIQVTEGKIQSDLKEDVFILGCFYYYVLDSQHRHPFGDNVVINSREKEIKNKDHKVYRPDWNHGLPTDKTQPESQAIAIIKDMIQYDPEKRPSIKSILDRAYFLPEDYYKLYDVPHQIPGLCVIFNQYKFDNKAAANREGTEKDKEALTKIFEEFGFKVEPHDNLKANEITEKMNELANDETKVYTKFGCLVVCILSHGDEGTICTSDGSHVSIEETKKKFYRSKSLKDKPKIWIIQACQGDQRQEDFEIKKIIETCEENQTENTTLETADAGDPEITENNSHNSDKNDDGTQKSASASSTLPDIPRPPVSDFLDIRATVPGCVSFRDPEKGSVLIQNLCEQMCHAFSDDEKSNRHLEDVLKKVQKRFSQNFTKLAITKQESGYLYGLVNKLSNGDPL